MSLVHGMYSITFVKRFLQSERDAELMFFDVGISNPKILSTQFTCLERYDISDC